MVESGTACALHPTQDFNYWDVLSNKAVEAQSLELTGGSVNSKHKHNPRWLPGELRKCCRQGEAEGRSPAGEGGAGCGCRCWEGCGWAQIQGGDLVWVVLTVLVV